MTDFGPGSCMWLGFEIKSLERYKVGEAKLSDSSIWDILRVLPKSLSTP